jgi:hypothetical protein
MISPDLLPHVLKALQRFIVHCQDQAYASGAGELAQLLNDIELLPEFVADDHDRTEELIETLHGLARIHPGCRYVVEEFDRAPGAAG